MTCKMCLERGKTWEGSDPVCPFDGGTMVSDENWNCATINALRDVVREGNNPEPDGIDYRYCEDQKYATVYAYDLLEGDNFPLALWVTWYKNRGGTDGLWLLFEDCPPRRPTEDEIITLISAPQYMKYWQPNNEEVTA